MNRILLFLGIAFFSNYVNAQKIGEAIDNYNGINVYYNGVPFEKAHGKSFASDGYYLGQKWQCVEFVRRYFYEKYNFKFPVWNGHAKSFFNFTYNQGELNTQRNCYQYNNWDNEKPKVDDILVFVTSKYGHVCIVTNVTENSVEVVQQNIEDATRVSHKLRVENGKYIVGDESVSPIGWLRIPANK
jgi:hypothetical protein